MAAIYSKRIGLYVVALRSKETNFSHRTFVNDVVEKIFTVFNSAIDGIILASCRSSPTMEDNWKQARNSPRLCLIRAEYRAIEKKFFFSFNICKSVFVRVCIRSLTLEINSYFSQLNNCIFFFSFQGKKYRSKRCYET